MAYKITIERDNNARFVASDDNFDIYGDGDTPEEALEDYRVSARDYYQLVLSRAKDNPYNRGIVHLLKYHLPPWWGDSVLEVTDAKLCPQT